jgi:hypothetical protein
MSCPTYGLPAAVPPALSGRLSLVIPYSNRDGARGHPPTLSFTAVGGLLCLIFGDGRAEPSAQTTLLWFTTYQHVKAMRDIDAEDGKNDCMRAVRQDRQRSRGRKLAAQLGSIKSGIDYRDASRSNRKMTCANVSALT